MADILAPRPVPGAMVASDWGGQIHDAVEASDRQGGIFIVRNGMAQNVPAATWHSVGAWSSIPYPAVGLEWNTWGGGAVRILKPGLWLMNARMRFFNFPANNVGFLGVAMGHGGAPNPVAAVQYQSQDYSGSIVHLFASGTWLLNLAVDDSVGLSVYSPIALTYDYGILAFAYQGAPSGMAYDLVNAGDLMADEDVTGQANMGLGNDL